MGLIYVILILCQNDDNTVHTQDPFYKEYPIKRTHLQHHLQDVKRFQCKFKYFVTMHSRF